MFDFSRLELEHFPVLKPYFKTHGQPHYCYTLPSLILWNSPITSETVFSIVDDAAVFAVREVGRANLTYCVLPVSTSGPKPPAWLKAIAIHNNVQEYCFVPDSYFDEFGRDEVEKYFTVFGQPEWNDYIYLASNLSEYPGKNYAKKRNLVRQFERRHVDTGEVEVGLLGPEDLDPCMACLDSWRLEQETVTNGFFEDERKAIEMAIQNLPLLELQGVKVSIRGKMAGFGIGALLQDNMWVLHFQKASHRVTGLYQYLDRECARRLFRGVPLLNKECDMGDAGLAKAKRSCHPAYLAKSYCLALKI